ncbi:DUF4395 domain-containing protein [Pedobacter sp. MC2016-05]|uniref:DUF4395 domain-containing protein n=1 Tax=Pedobacter sp. MC2016-05 TaxID=2994474 RepID=UPI002247C035|nr:DUF4395 domain-containing protein [Pedobacter sp. MC2016-05]MCX2475634.1 DUF4395 domain-containing protein [Pedobacter sp. MC2016-05]
MEISCPISAERVNENVVRLIAFIVACIAIGCVIFSNYWVMFFLTVDFALRAFSSGKFSPMKFVAINLANAFSLKPKMTDLAPKKFAATMGFVFCLLITATFILNFLTVALTLTAIMIIFALLESLLGVCVGCYVYTFVNLISKGNKY